jgi:hypothetical protein
VLNKFNDGALSAMTPAKNPIAQKKIAGKKNPKATSSDLFCERGNCNPNDVEAPSFQRRIKCGE